MLRSVSVGVRPHGPRGESDNHNDEDNDDDFAYEIDSNSTPDAF